MQTEQTRKPRKKFIESFKENFSKIVIVAVSLVYIGQGVFKIQKKDTTLIAIFGAIGLSIIVGLVISNNLKAMGLRDGRRSEIFLNSMKTYGNAKENATPYFDKLFYWCEYKNDQELQVKKKEIIQSAGLNWKAFRLGYYEEHQEKLSEKQIESLEKAKTCTVNRMTSQEILSDLPKMKWGKFGSDSRFGESEQEYKVKGLILNTISRFFVGIVCGLYGLSPIFSKENLSEIIAGVVWNTIQILLWLAIGLMEYSNSKDFIEVEYRQTHIIQKTELLNEFVVTMKNNPKVIEEYDDDYEIELFVQEYIESQANKRKKEIMTDEEKGIIN